MDTNHSIRTVKDLKIYQLSFELAMSVFEISKGFPSEEKFSLTDQIRRSSRSVTANIREGFGKRHFPKSFIRHLVDAVGASEETLTWLDFAGACNYTPKNESDNLFSQYNQLSSMIANTKKNCK